MATVAVYGAWAYLINAALVYSAYVGIQAANQSMPGPQDQEGSRLSDVKAAGSAYGVAIPDLRGSARMPGNIIWAGDILEVSSVSEVAVPGPGNDYDLRTYDYFVSFAVQLCRTEILGIRRIWANNKLVYSQAEDADEATLAASNKFAQYMTVYTGTEDQMPDPTIAAREGAENTPAFRGTAYIVFEELPLKDLLNNFPQLSFEVVQNGSVGGTQITRVPVDLSAIINGITTRAGIDPLRVDTSGVSENVRGLLVNGTTYFEALAPALAAYNIDVFQSGYTLRFRRIVDADVVDIDESELGRSGKKSFVINRKRETALPQRLAVIYHDYDRDYLSGTQQAQRIAGSARNKQELRTALSLTAADAAQIAETALYAEWLKRLTYSLKLPPRFLGLEPGDVIRLTSATMGLLTMRAVKVQVGADLSMEVDAEAWTGTVLSSSAPGHSGQLPEGTVRISGDTDLLVLDINAPSDALAANPYLMFSMSGEVPWRSATLFKSSDSRASYQPAVPAPGYTSAGVTASTLAAGPNTVWDNVNTVDVVMSRGALSTGSDEAILNGANLLLIGDEILQFVVATLIAPNTWRLSRLLRGRRGTEAAMSLHGIGERVVLLGSAYTVSMTLAEIGAVRWWRAPSQDQILSESPEVAATYQAIGLKPYAPCFVRGARNGSSDLTITFIRRSRVGSELPSGTDIPLGEASERYEVEIMNGASPVRSTIVTTPEFIYTSAMQVADFGSNQSAVAVNIFQLSESVGRGYATSATL